jgi:hypothetical protein
MKHFTLLFFYLGFILTANANRVLVPMDPSQKNHLKAYGVAYWVLKQDLDVDWLLNYRDGSFMLPYTDAIEKECRIRGVSYELISEAEVGLILNEIAKPDVNMELVKLHKAPKIAVYSPKTKQPWDDAVTMVLTYAEIPYTEIYDTEVIQGELVKYDWLHLHHEDFTGQYGKFYGQYRNAAWYQDEVNNQQNTASALGFSKVSEMKRQVSLNIRNFVLGGGFLFTMCSGTDSYDISLAAENVDICESVFDGDPSDPQAQQKLQFENGFAFQNYRIIKDPMTYEFSTIDATEEHGRLGEINDFFTLFDFSAKWDIVPTILTQNHTQVIKGFMGQTTAFKNDYIKSNVTVMGQTKSLGSARYIHGELGQGQWTYYGGHDPEDYRHLVGDPPTDLALHPNSPGYRLILNNILFPAAKRKKQKT